MLSIRPALGTIPRVSLGNFPTPVERVDGVLPRNVTLWVKREDRAAVVYGGNKVRKLEFLLGEAMAMGRSRVATIGGWGSHHALATALFARQLGLGCDLFLFPQPMNDHVREQLRADVAAGARVHASGSFVGLGPKLLAARLASDVAYLAAGGSSPTGSLGWVAGADEIREQVAANQLPRLDAIYVALGSCGTVAGLLAGFRGYDNAPEIVGVRVVERPIAGFGPTRSLEEKIAQRLKIDSFRPTALRVEHAQIGRGYGYATPAAVDAVARAADAGLLLETTYTGKAFAQLIADANSGRLDGKHVLFIDTYSSVDLSRLLERRAL